MTWLMSDSNPNILSTRTRTFLPLSTLHRWLITGSHRNARLMMDARVILTWGYCNPVKLTSLLITLSVLTAWVDWTRAMSIANFVISSIALAENASASAGLSVLSAIARSLPIFSVMSSMSALSVSGETCLLRL